MVSPPVPLSAPRAQLPSHIAAAGSVPIPDVARLLCDHGYPKKFYSTEYDDPDQPVVSLSS